MISINEQDDSLESNLSSYISRDEGFDDASSTDSSLAFNLRKASTKLVKSGLSIDPEKAARDRRNTNSLSDLADMIEEEQSPDNESMFSNSTLAN